MNLYKDGEKSSKFGNVMHHIGILKDKNIISIVAEKGIPIKLKVIPTILAWEMGFLS